MPSTNRTTAALGLAVGLLALVGPAQAQAPLLEVEKSDATKLLQVTDDAGFLIRGTLGTGIIPASGAGMRFMWYPKKAAFRAGIVEGSQWDDAAIGAGSVALGTNTTASGPSSVALNAGTEASGNYSIAGGLGSAARGQASLAVGQLVLASGPKAVAFGEKTEASGHYSLAAGIKTKATGNAAMAMGFEVEALGVASVAMGSAVSAKDGSFIFGDNNTGFPITTNPNEFWARAFGGVRLRTGPNNIGCDLAAGSGAWSCSSSKLLKEDFEDVNGEEVLARLKQLPIQSWRYIGTTARHIGPFSEDFQAAFGMGDSSDKITQIDADGVALRAAQALEQRTAALQEENAALRVEITELLRRVEALERSGPSTSSRGR